MVIMWECEEFEWPDQVADAIAAFLGSNPTMVFSGMEEFGQGRCHSDADIPDSTGRDNFRSHHVEAVKDWVIQRVDELKVGESMDLTGGAAKWVSITVEAIDGPSEEPGRHEFVRRPSYDGYAGMCVCGFEPSEPSYASLGLLIDAVREHLERDVFPAPDEAALRKEADAFKIGPLLGYHRLIETTREHGTQHAGWLIAGARGSVRIRGDEAFGEPLGQWISFTQESRDG
ncbi:hypothetical protein ABGB09_34050 [Streptomyces sp. B8F3]|uniref:hypothetical protein n=1 Tax=Streptomyces sp. B8F3 TaxID=3153573 RepID=UPI00325E3F80